MVNSSTGSTAARAADLAVGESARMVRVSDKDPSLLRYLADIALQPGAEITLIHRAPFDGPMTLRVAGQVHGVLR